MGRFMLATFTSQGTFLKANLLGWADRESPCFWLWKQILQLLGHLPQSSVLVKQFYILYRTSQSSLAFVGCV